MPKTRSGWKRYERDVLAPGGGERIPVSGRHPGEPDGRHPYLPGFYIEIRSRTRARPLRWMKEVWEEARAAGQKPCVIFRGPAPHLSPLVLLRWADLQEVIHNARLSGAARPAAPGEGPGPDRGPRDGCT